jgi:DNA-binding response OmpR family regulator
MMIEIATNLAQGRQAIAQEAFDGVLLDLTFSETGENGLTFLAELMNQNPSLPVLVMTGRKRLMDRVEVARLGGRAFLQKPILPHRLLEMANQVLTQSQEVGRRILVVDDDPLILATLDALLEPWGLQVATLDDPQQFWEVLEAFAPDLLILDVEMPHFNGLELCQAVRNDPYWGELPVLFLTAHQDAEVIRQIFMVGADDYVRKPIVEPEIVARVLNRLERVRARRKWMGNEIDLEASSATNVPVSIIL